MIYDCFLFNDEIELLELRMMETYDFVDKFVLVESPYNWQLKPKPLFYHENQSSFEQWADKIIHVVADPIPLKPFPVTETAQRNYMEQGLRDADFKDTIIVSDADEIMSREALVTIRNKPPSQPIALRQILYYYSVNCRQNQPWNGPVALPRGLSALYGHEVRAMRNQLQGIAGGWHFSWMGDVTRLQYKLLCHTVEEDSGGKIVPPDPGDTQHLAECLKTGKDLFGRTEHYAQKEFVDIVPGETHPVTMLAWLEKYPWFKHAV